MNNDNRIELFACNRFVGAIEGAVLCKTIKGSRHILRDPRAICLSEAGLQEGERRGITAIEITDSETGTIYSTTLEYFKEYCFEVHRGGFERQLGMRIERWTTSLDQNSRALKPGEVKWSHAKAPRKKNLPKPKTYQQPGLFKESKESRKWWKE